MAVAPVKIPSSLDALPGGLPSIPISQDADAQAAVDEIVAKLASLKPTDIAEDGFWRDQFSLTGTLRTFFGPEPILAAYQSLVAARGATKFEVVEKSGRNAGNWIEGRFTFKAAGPPGVLCSGLLYLVEIDGAWKIWMLCTILEDIIGHLPVDLRNNPAGAPLITSTPLGERGDFEQFDCVIVGGGQSGLATAGWMKGVGLKYVVIEKNASIGENWTNRYSSVKLHTTQRFNDLPFGPTFTDKDPQFLPAQSLASGYQKYATQFDINIWLSTTLPRPAVWNDKGRFWDLEVLQGGTEKNLRARWLILATGPGGTVPMIPSFPGLEDFEGTWLHSRDYKDADKWAGKKVVVVGTANTGHDVASDAVTAGANVTMVQRGVTYVVPRTYFIKLFNLIWNDTLPQELSDRFFWSPPTGVSRHMVMSYLNGLVDADGEFFDQLDATGFRSNRKGDFIDHLLVRFGGHYMNCGTSEKIIAKQIAIKNDSAITSYNSKGLTFDNGSTLDADVVVMCTGFEKDVASAAVPVVGQRIVRQLDKYWGVDAEGEISGAFKPCGHAGLLLTGGGCCHARYFTRFLALQVLADCIGTPLLVYAK